MCVAMPGKVISIKGTIATVDFSGNTIEAQAGLVSIKIGDYVLVHAGCILQVLSQDEGDSLVDLFREIEEMTPTIVEITPTIEEMTPTIEEMTPKLEVKS